MLEGSETCDKKSQINMFIFNHVFIELRADLNTTGVPASPFSGLCSISS